MKPLYFFTALIILIALPGCNGGGHKLVVGDMQVPESVLELGSAICEIEASGDTGITYAWAVDPATAGTFDPQDGSLSTLSASEVEGDTEVTIRIVISSDHSDPVTKSAPLLVKESDEVPPWIRNQPPYAAAHASTTSVEPGDVIQFFDDSTDPDGVDDIVSWEWDFSYVEEDGFQVESQERNPLVQFNEERIFQIQLRVTDSEGLTDFLDEPLTVSVLLVQLPPLAQAYAVTTVVPEDFFILFHDTSTDPNGDEDIIKREWDFSYDASEGFHVESEERDPYIQFSIPGEFEVQLRVTDTAGNSDILDESIGITVYDRGWVQTWGNTDDDAANSIAVDSFGHIYVVGNFSEIVDFDPGPGEAKFDGHGGSAYLMKLDSRGGVFWVKTWRNAGAHTLKISPAGIICVLGYYADETDLDPGPGSFYTLNNTSGNYMSQFDLYGNFISGLITKIIITECIWTIGLTDYDRLIEGEDIMAAIADPPYIYAVINSYHQYYNSNQGWSTKIYNDYSLRQLDSFAPGGLIKPFWTIPLLHEDGHYGLDQLGDGSILVYYDNVVPWNIYPQIPYISAYSPDGNILWSTTYAFLDCDLRQLAVDKSNNIYTTGNFSGLMDFDPGPGEFIMESDSTYWSPYVSKFNSTGDFVWASKLSESGQVYGEYVTADPLGNVYVAGAFSGFSDFDPGPGEFIRLGYEDSSSYVTVFDPSGNWKWVGNWSAPIYLDSYHHPFAYPVIATDSGETFITGTFYGTADFNPTWDVTTTTAVADYDAYLLKILPPGVW